MTLTLHLYSFLQREMDLRMADAPVDPKSIEQGSAQLRLAPRPMRHVPGCAARPIRERRDAQNGGARSCGGGIGNGIAASRGT
jgi:hypothetical protein